MIHDRPAARARERAEELIERAAQIFQVRRELLLNLHDARFEVGAAPRRDGLSFLRAARADAPVGFFRAKKQLHQLRALEKILLDFSEMLGPAFERFGDENAAAEH